MVIEIKWNESKLILRNPMLFNENKICLKIAYFAEKYYEYIGMLLLSSTYQMEQGKLINQCLELFSFRIIVQSNLYKK